VGIGFMVTTKQVWDGFVTLLLLADCQQQSKVLEDPHTGAQKDHALHAQNLHFHVHGQPKICHYCEKCLWVYEDGNKVLVVVMMELQWDVHAAQSTIARYLLKTTDITSVLTTSLKTWSVQSLAVILL
jgi:hypothetical protein